MRNTEVKREFQITVPPEGIPMGRPDKPNVQRWMTFFTQVLDKLEDRGLIITSSSRGTGVITIEDEPEILDHVARVISAVEQEVTILLEQSTPARPAAPPVFARSTYEEQLKRVQAGK